MDVLRIGRVLRGGIFKNIGRRKQKINIKVRMSSFRRNEIPLYIFSMELVVLTNEISRGEAF